MSRDRHPWKASLGIALPVPACRRYEGSCDARMDRCRIEPRADATPHAAHQRQDRALHPDFAFGDGRTPRSRLIGRTNPGHAAPKRRLQCHPVPLDPRPESSLAKAQQPAWPRHAERRFNCTGSDRLETAAHLSVRCSTMARARRHCRSSPSADTRQLRSAPAGCCELSASRPCRAGSGRPRAPSC